MAKIYDLGTRSIPSLRDRYPLVEGENIPKRYQVAPISYRSDEIEKCDVIFLHRLMKRNYGNPCEIDGQLNPDYAEKLGVSRITTTGEGDEYKVKLPSLVEMQVDRLEELENSKVPAIGIEWRYFVSTQSGAILQIGTKDLHAAMLIAHVLPEKMNQPSRTMTKEAQKFISDLLKEAERLKGQILNPKKEFDKGEGVQLYLLYNVYLYNYGSAELMLESADNHEQKLRNEFLKYDARTDDLKDPEKAAHTNKYMRACGMYYAASISYYYMALEGFVNLLYHAFLREEFRDAEFNLEKRLDLEQKIGFMARLCNGFRDIQIDRKSDTFQKFKRLRDYRNQIFHSKIVDALKSVCLVESGFFYTCDMEKNKKNLLPPHKTMLSKECVLLVKTLVDEIIEEILSRMEERQRILTDEFIMKETAVPFWKTKTGEIMLGRSQSGPIS